jgi:hypothetical protein
LPSGLRTRNDDGRVRNARRAKCRYVHLRERVKAAALALPVRAATRAGVLLIVDPVAAGEDLMRSSPSDDWFPE